MNQVKTTKLRFGEKLAYGLGDCSANVYVALSGTFLTGYYTDTVGIAAAAIATMMLITRIFDGITDLFMGVIVDNTQSKYGKARPWILWTAPFMGLGLIALFMVPQSLSSGGKLAYAYISYILMNCIIYTANNLPYNALLARMTLNVQDRASTAAMRFIMTQFTTLIVNVATTKLLPTMGWTKLIVIYGVIETVMLLICFFGCKEHIGVNAKTGEVHAEKISVRDSLPAVLRNKYFYLQILIFCLTFTTVVSSGSMGYFYSSYVLGNMQVLSMISMATTIPAIIVNFFTPSLTARMGKRRLMMLGCGFMVLGSLIVGMANTNTTLMLTGVAIRSFGFGPLSACVFALTADVVDFGEWKSGIRAEGVINSCTSFGMKIGIGLGSAASGWILAYGGYNGAAAQQSASALSAIRFGFGYFGAILALLCMIVLFLMDLDKYLGQVQIDLEEKHAAM